MQTKWLQYNSFSLGRHFVCGSKLSIHTALLCLVAYVNDLASNQYSIYAGIKSQITIANWKEHFRIICPHSIDESCGEKNWEQERTFKIDKTLIFKHKNHVGRLLTTE